jgi:hypothetical protein
MKVSLQRTGVVIFCQIGYLSVFAQIFVTQVFFLDVRVDDILDSEMCHPPLCVQINRYRCLVNNTTVLSIDVY